MLGGRIFQVEELNTNNISDICCESYLYELRVHKKLIEFLSENRFRIFEIFRFHSNKVEDF